MSLTDRQIALAKGMILRGDDQHHIAALFGTNSGRIAETANGMKPPDPDSDRVERGRDIEPASPEMIEQYYPTIPKIELNRRGPPRPGWDAWGNEVEAEAA